MINRARRFRSYVRHGAVDYGTARWLLVGAVPSVAGGTLVAHRVPGPVLELVYGGGLLVLAGFLILQTAPEECEAGAMEGDLVRKRSRDKSTTVTRARDGTVDENPTCLRPPGGLLAAVGGGLTGLISAGHPEISTTQLIVRCRLPLRVAVATSVFVLAITALVGAGVHALSAVPAWHVVVWSIPGVPVGSTVGSRVGKHLPADLVETVLGGVLAAVGILVLVAELLS